LPYSIQAAAPGRVQRMKTAIFHLTMALYKFSNSSTAPILRFCNIVCDFSVKFRICQYYLSKVVMII